MILIERRTKRGSLLGFNTEGTLVARECTLCKEYSSTELNFTKKNTSLKNFGFDTQCKKCNSRPEKRKKFNEYRYKKREENREEYLAGRRNYRKKNIERAREIDRQWDEKNKEVNRKRAREWKKRNPHIANEYTTRRTRLLKEQKERLTPEMLSDIKNIYKECSKLKKEHPEVSYCVDHIIPLNPQDNSVCGLHISCNLQIITKLENSRKKDKFDGTYENESWRLKYE